MVGLALFLLIIVTSVALSLAGSFLNRKFEDAPPFAWCVTYATTVVVVGMLTIFSFVLGGAGRSVGEQASPGLALVSSSFGAMITLCLGIAIYYYPIVLSTFMLTGMFSEMMVGSLYGSSLLGATRTNFGKAEAMALEGGIIAAARLFRKYYEEDPKVPTPLFRAAWLLAEHKIYPESEKMYRDIMKLFEKNTRIWAEAGFRLAELYFEKMDRKEDSLDVLREILRRARHGEDRRRAAETLTMMS